MKSNRESSVCVSDIMKTFSKNSQKALKHMIQLSSISISLMISNKMRICELRVCDFKLSRVIEKFRSSVRFACLQSTYPVWSCHFK